MGESSVSAVREDFVSRIGRHIRAASNGTRMDSREWQFIADEFLEYLGALSVESPELDTPEAKAVLADATEAAAGAVAYAVYHGWDRFQISLSYVNFGMSYGAEERDEEEERSRITSWELIDALCLVILSDQADRHGEAIGFARDELGKDAEGDPAVELVNGLLVHVLNYVDDESYPPSAQQKLAAVEAALDRIGAERLEHRYTVALRTLRALMAEDREAFDAGLTALLLAHREASGSRPDSLLPLLPLALAALAYRGLGWAPAVDTGYLPRALVTGFETAGPRVGAFGRDCRPDAVAALAAAPLVIERLGPPAELTPELEARFEEAAEEAIAKGRFRSALHYQEILLKKRAAHTADATDAQLANVRLGSGIGAAAFRLAGAEPGTEVGLTIDGRNRSEPAGLPMGVGLVDWHTALDFALITGIREHLAAVVLAGPGTITRDVPAYSQALHDYFRGDDPRPATERALREYGDAPGVVLFSQLIDGDEESFNLALADALEAHRAHYAVADRADESDAALDLGILALTCHARRRGWTIRVESPYLPPRLLQAAEPF
ncbi:hypothetical protein F7Q99_11145 [Streptomyces kaniharaensis]|uniref:Immunity 49 family protein n=1 Tax=Streptomyces kaniharaensis TaxID=212423 RepID=A0A6N7KTA3_9ACTN|nr:hypothetical protein [Streptomyces kaniharaensis]